MDIGSLVSRLQAIGMKLSVNDRGNLEIDGDIGKLTEDEKREIKAKQRGIVDILNHAALLRKRGRVEIGVEWARGQRGVLRLTNPLTGETTDIDAKGQPRWLFERIEKNKDK
jgi:hypothetical protein